MDRSMQPRDPFAPESDGFMQPRSINFADVLKKLGVGGPGHMRFGSGPGSSGFDRGAGAKPTGQMYPASPLDKMDPEIKKHVIKENNSALDSLVNDPHTKEYLGFHYEPLVNTLPSLDDQQKLNLYYLLNDFVQEKKRNATDPFVLEDQALKAGRPEGDRIKGGNI
jgi:hypothetical protein